MSEAIDVLKQELKSHGLEIGEDTAVAVFKAVVSTAKKVAAATPSPLDDVGAQVLQMAEPVVLGLLDKIDGQVG